MIAKNIISVGLFFIFFGAKSQSDSTFIRGGWFYHVLEKEANGFVYKQEDQPKDCFQSVAEAGWNYAGIEILTKPGIHDIHSNLQLAKRINDAGLKIAVNFLYGDHLSYRQIPEGWPNSYPELKNKVYEYTLNTLKALDSIGIKPGLVKVGNEVDHLKYGGFFLPHGKMYSEKFYELLQIGCRAVRDFDPKIKIVLHSYVPKDNEQYLQGLIDHKVDFDIIGFSFYPHWGGFVKNLPDHLKKVERFQKEIMIIETSTPWSNYSADNITNTNNIEANDYSRSPLSAHIWYSNASRIISEHPLGTGVFVWPSAYPSIADSPSTKENQTFWDSTTGNFVLLPALGIGGKSPVFSLSSVMKDRFLTVDSEDKITSTASKDLAIMFTLVALPKGQFILRCVDNGKYISIQKEKTVVLVSSKEMAERWKPLDHKLGYNKGKVAIAIQSVSTGKHLMIDSKNQLVLSEISDNKSTNTAFYIVLK